MEALYPFLKPYRIQFFLSCIYSITNKILDLAPPFIVGWMVDVVVMNPVPWVDFIAQKDIIKGIWLVGASIFVIFGFESYFEWLYKKNFMEISQKVQHDLRIKLYDNLQKKDTQFFENARTGNLISILSEDISQLEKFISEVFNELLQVVILVVFSAIAFYMVSPLLCLLAMSSIPFIIWGSYFYEKLVTKRYFITRKSAGELNNRLENNIGGIGVIKSFTTEAFESERVNKASTAFKIANLDIIKYRAAYEPLIRIFIAFGFAAVLVVPAFWIMNGTHDITIGQLAIFGMLVQRLLWPMTRLGKVFDDTAKAKASSLRIFGLMDTPVAIVENEQPIPFPIVQFGIDFKDVSFGYFENKKPVLTNLNIHIPAGKTTGIMGPTGAGKTSLTKLILRLYDPTEGSLLIDYTNIKEFSLHDLRSAISLVSQDVYVFHGNFSENIAYGCPDVSREAIIEAAKKSTLHDFINGLEMGYDSLVGERGIKLSGGQRQRLSIARAILKNAPILILDEATSSVDTETELVIKENIKSLSAGKTTIIIAHRLSTLVNADQIIVLESGAVSEKGTHDELLFQNGLYAKMWNIQANQ
jgi:ATP-binding cassette subfamily B protein